MKRSIEKLVPVAAWARAVRGWVEHRARWSAQRTLQYSVGSAVRTERRRYTRLRTALGQLAGVDCSEKQAPAGRRRPGHGPAERGCGHVVTNTTTEKLDDVAWADSIAVAGDLAVVVGEKGTVFQAEIGKLK